VARVPDDDSAAALLTTVSMFSVAQGDVALMFVAYLIQIYLHKMSD